jgi:signal transduction histidine kinase
MRLAPKIFLVSALVIVVLSVAVGWSARTVERLVVANQDIATHSVPAMRLQGALRESVGSLVRLETRALVLRDQDYAAAWSRRAARLAEDLAALDAHLETDAQRSAYRRLQSALEEYRRHVEAERQHAASAQPAAALRIAEGPAREAVMRAETALDEMATATGAALAASQARARTLEDSTWRAVAMALLLSVAVALGASALLAYRMTRALGRFTTATASLAAGTWTGPMAAEGRDEIGDLGRSFNRMAARLQEVDRLKEEFFSQISHDLRNPLASIRLAAETMLERARAAGDARQARFAYLIDASAVRMLSLVNQILDFTRLRANAMPLDRRPVDVLKTVVRAMDEMRPLADEKRVRVDLAADGGDFTALAEEGSLVRVVVNLLGNAIAFTPAAGAVTLRLTADGHRLELQVRDTGVGIPAEALPWIFEPYRQAHGQAKGTGLGLAVVKGLVDAHGGTVRVESEPGQGSCFTVTIPKAEAAA